MVFDASIDNVVVRFALAKDAAGHLAAALRARSDSMFGLAFKADTVFQIEDTLRFLSDAHPEKFARTIDGVRYQVAPHE